MAKNEYFGIYQSLVQADSESLRNPALSLYLTVVKFNYEKQWTFIRFIGTHAEYEKIDANKI
ncbi:hypothetical protein CW751_14090 [Brumimicrobium salinarum]|uniref:Type II toxin-antitoxin system HigB family toxin n=1 Tax=Brumimicrobium salinarum TaxID=2058658 RepID=A0A2I0QZ58_9FLAO|nr:hypothetical protein CW751_14090 [Brumimicrobium salinarum]